MHRLSIFYIISVSIVTTQSIFVQTPTYNVLATFFKRFFFRLKEKTNRKEPIHPDGTQFESNQ